MNTDQSLKNKLRRLNDIVSGNRFNDFSSYDVFEIILSYVMNEDGVSAAAQRISNKFGSVSAALDAPIEALTEALNGDERTATLFKLVKTLGLYYRVDKINGGKRFVSVDDIAEYCIHRFSGDSRETLSVLLIDPNMRMMGLETIHEGDQCSVNVSYEKIAEAVFRYRASSFIMIHNHPAGMIRPSESDFALTYEIASRFAVFNKRLAEHIIISDSSYFPVMQIMRLSAKRA